MKLLNMKILMLLMTISVVNIGDATHSILLIWNLQLK